jgi:hypothetical protein
MAIPAERTTVTIPPLLPLLFPELNADGEE